MLAPPRLTVARIYVPRSLQSFSKDLRPRLQSAVAGAPPKSSYDAPDGPPEELLVDCLHSKRVDIARSQGNAHMGVSESNSSEKVFGNLLRKVGEAAKCLVNGHAKARRRRHSSREQGAGRGLCGSLAPAEASSKDNAKDAEMTDTAKSDSI